MTIESHSLPSFLTFEANQLDPLTKSAELNRNRRKRAGTMADMDAIGAFFTVSMRLSVYKAHACMCVCEPPVLTVPPAVLFPRQAGSASTRRTHLRPRPRAGRSRSRSCARTCATPPLPTTVGMRMALRRSVASSQPRTRPQATSRSSSDYNRSSSSGPHQNHVRTASTCRFSTNRRLHR